MFLNGGTFGAQGIQIFTHDGFLVPWVATVEINITVQIHFTAPNCSPQFHLDLPDFGGVYLQTDGFPIIATSAEPCQLTHGLSLSDGREFNNESFLIEGENIEIELNYSSESTENAVASLEGYIHCGNDSLYLKTQILTLGRIPIETLSIGTLPAFESSTIEISIESLGNSTQTFTVFLDGPISRIGTVSNQILLDGSDKALIEIQPNGLLEDRMSIKGELILLSQSGHRWSLEIEYTAEDSERSILEEWRTPGKLLGSAGIICILWVFVGMFERKKLPRKVQQSSSFDKQAVQIEIQQDSDAWGRSIDD